MNTVDRIIFFIDQIGISQRKFDESIGKSKGYINKTLQQGSALSSKTIMDIKKAYPELNIDWVLTGKGSMLNKDKFAASKDSKDFNILMESTTEYLANRGQKLKENKHSSYKIPEFEGRADFYLRITDNSLFPKYVSGDILVCKKVDTINYMRSAVKPYVIETDQGYFCRKLYKHNENSITCISDNSDYNEFKLNIKDIKSIAIILGGICFE